MDRKRMRIPTTPVYWNDCGGAAPRSHANGLGRTADILASPVDRARADGVDSPPGHDYSARAFILASKIFLGCSQRKMDSCPRRCANDRKSLRMPAHHTPMNACARARSAYVFLD